MKIVQLINSLLGRNYEQVTEAPKIITVAEFRTIKVDDMQWGKLYTVIWENWTSRYLSNTKDYITMKNTIVSVVRSVCELAWVNILQLRETEEWNSIFITLEIE